MEKIPLGSIGRRSHVGGAMPFEGHAPRSDLLIPERRIKIVGESVSDLADNPEIIPDRLVDQTEAVSSSCSISIGAEWLIVSQQFRYFLRIIYKK